jgi:hypothetical protein
MTETGAAKQTAPITYPIAIKQNTVVPPILSAPTGVYVEFHNESSIDRTIQFVGLSPISLYFSPGAKATFLAGSVGTVRYTCGDGKSRDDGPYEVIVGGGVGGSR